MTGVFKAECSLCVSDYHDHVMRAISTPIPTFTGEAPPPRTTWQNPECQKIDCALSDAMLERLEDRCGYSRLRKLRDEMVKRGPSETRTRQFEWQKHQEHMEELREEAARSAKPVVTGDWDHALPGKVLEVVTNFDEDREAWAKLCMLWENASSDSPRRYIVGLGGPPHIGKTCAAGYWLSKVPGGRFVTASHAASLREAAVTGKDRSEIEALRTAPALVIDDTDRDGVSDMDRARIAEIVRAREAKRLPTTLTMISGKGLPTALAKRARLGIAS